MNYEDLSDDLELSVTPKIDTAAIAIRGNIERVESALTEFDKISAGLSALTERFPPDLAYDVTTTKGMAEAVAHRAAWREPRITVEKLRKTAKAPVLALGKDIDARAAWLTDRLLEGEAPADEQIQAELRRKDEAKQARINAEAGRVIAIQEAIGEFGMTAMSASSKSSALIAEALASMKAQVLGPAVFQEMLEQAKAAQRAAIDKLEVTYRAKLHDETEAEKVAAERAELAQLRAQASEQKRKDDLAAQEAQRVESERVAADLKARQAEQARLDAESATARKEADRVAAEQRAAAQAEHEAKMKAEREAAAESQRLADAAAARALAKKRKDEAADKKIRDAAHTMLAALREVRPLCADEQARRIIDAAIREATGDAPQGFSTFNLAA